MGKGLGALNISEKLCKICKNLTLLRMAELTNETVKIIMQGNFISDDILKIHSTMVFYI